MCESSPRGGSNSEEDSDDSLWESFENSAQAVAHLFRNANWRNLQLAAASTTQLYKSGLDMKKRSFERGFNSGRQALAKEIYGLCRYSGTKIDVGTLLSRCSPLSTDMHAISPRRQRNPSIQAAEMTSSSAAVIRKVLDQQTRLAKDDKNEEQAVSLFQKALSPAIASSSPHRSPELNTFLQNQVRRHRKRQHSPISSVNQSSNSSHDAYSLQAALMNKRFKHL